VRKFCSPERAEYIALSGLHILFASATQGTAPPQAASLHPGLRVLRAFGTMLVAVASRKLRRARYNARPRSAVKAEVFSREAAAYSQPRVERACERNPGLASCGISVSLLRAEYIALSGLHILFASATQGSAPPQAASLHPGLRVLRAFGTLSGAAASRKLRRALQRATEECGEGRSI
ncbi:MAG: hypothetical protein Q8921_13435, partial [Bacteroidota bacterium]|nr:hypothetical protein [Bacteroidota bacterium]